MHLQCSDGSLHPLWCSQSIRGNIFNNSSKQDNEKASLYKPYYQYSSLDGNRLSFSEFNSNLPCNIFTNSSTSVHDCCLTILFNSHIRRIVRTSTIQNYEVKEEQEF